MNYKKRSIRPEQVLKEARAMRRAGLKAPKLIQKPEDRINDKQENNLKEHASCVVIQA